MSDNGTDYFRIQLPKAVVIFDDQRSVTFVAGDMADLFSEIRKQCEPVAADDGAWWKAIRGLVQQEKIRFPKDLG